MFSLVVVLLIRVIYFVKLHNKKKKQMEMEKEKETFSRIRLDNRRLSSK